jgi:hypothetical protein
MKQQDYFKDKTHTSWSIYKNQTESQDPVSNTVCL